MRLKDKIKHRFPLLVDFALAAQHFLMRLGRRHPPQLWSEDVRPSRARISLGDVPTGFFLRLALEAGYHNVVELGTYDGARISTIKRLAPQLTCHGFDIGPRFRSAFEENGVAFGPFDMGIFGKLPRRTLVVCVQTLTCMPESEVRELFGQLAQHGHDIAFFEPQPLFDPGLAAPIERTLTGQTGLYHDYPRLTQTSGLTMRLVGEDRAWSHTGATKTLERVQPYYATAKANA